MLEVNHQCWVSDLVESSISIKDSLYTLKVKNNKRKLIYKNRKFIATVPYIIDENKEVTNYK